MFLIINHRITEIQKQWAVEHFRITEFIVIPDELASAWRSVSPDDEKISPGLGAIKQWLGSESSPGDYALIQGEFGAVYIMVNYAFQLGLIPVYSTTERHAVEKRDGDAVIINRVFIHRIFRRYETGG